MVVHWRRGGGSEERFTGIPFDKDHPYNYPEAKRVLNLAMKALRHRKDLQRQLGIEDGGHHDIRNEGWPVWDVIHLKGTKANPDFTRAPHLTLSIQYNRAWATLTLPNSLESSLRRNLLNLSTKQFLSLMEEVEHNLYEKLQSTAVGYNPWIQILQRWFGRQGACAVHHANLQFDMRTVTEEPAPKSKDRVKCQPEWLETTISVLKRKGLRQQPNLQLSIGAIFPYERCPAIHTPNALDAFAATWISCKPILHVVLGRA